MAVSVHANDLVGPAGTYSRFLRQSRGHARRDCSPVSRLPGVGEKTPATAPAHRGDRTAPLSLRTQAKDPRNPSPQAASGVKEAAGLDVARAASTPRAGLFVARDPLRLGEAGTHI